MDDVTRYGLMVLLVSVALFAAIVSTRISTAIRICQFAPAIFLVAAAVAADLVPARARCRWRPISASSPSR